MSVISTNVLALTSQNNLTKSQSALGSAIERLSSGMRINSAKDDAAGQAIANRFTANIKGLTQAGRNANDGISIAQTTEGSLNEINNNLQRIRELSVQAANGSNSDTDLQSIQNEINERLDEIDRVSRETQFNGKYVLGENGNTLSIQVGAHDGQKIDINLEEINRKTLDLEGFNITTKIDTTKVAASATTFAETRSDVPKNLGFKAPAGASGAATFGSLQVVKSSAGVETYHIKASGATGTGASAANGWYKVDVTEAGLALGSRSGSTSPAGVSAATSTYQTSHTVLTGDDSDKVHVYSGNGRDYVVKDKNDAGEDVYYEAKISKSGEVSRGAELNTEDWKKPLADIDNALQQVDDLRSHLGAIQNRFESTIANLSNTTTNLSAARSRIEDADYAVEVSNMTRAQILQQAGTSVLAQANQVPQSVLSLLR